MKTRCSLYNDVIEANFKKDNADILTTVVEYPDNQRLQLLFGEHHVNLSYLEHHLNVVISAFGNKITLIGPKANIEVAEFILNNLYNRLATEESLNTDQIDQEIFEFSKKSLDLSYKNIVQEKESSVLSIVTPKKNVLPRTPAQVQYIQALQHHPIVFALGPAGTGKSYLAVAMAVSFLMSGKVNRIILTRPAVEAGEHLGFLPGDLKEKVDPYLRPLYDALHATLPAESVAKRLAKGEIEIAPLAFMRGRTLNNAFIILDEAQNTTIPQMKMFLTRLGHGSIMSINGDLTQVDLPKGVSSGLNDAVHLLKEIPEIKMVYFSSHDVLRHSLVSKILNAYGTN